MARIIFTEMQKVVYRATLGIFKKPEGNTSAFILKIKFPYDNMLSFKITSCIPILYGCDTLIKYLKINIKQQ